MFKVSEVIGVKKGNQVFELNKISELILVPETLTDTINKINHFMGYQGFQEVEFINGYGVFPGGYIDKRGRKTQLNIPLYDLKNFSCDRMLYNLGYINGFTGNKLELNIAKSFVAGKPFSEGLAPVLGSDKKWRYLDINGKVVGDNSYIEASCFFGGFAIVKIAPIYDSMKWQVIDKSFKGVNCNLFKNYDDENKFYELMKIFDNNPSITRVDPTISKRIVGNITIFIDNEIGLSIRVYEILEAIKKKFNIKLVDGNAKEQLIDAISKISAIGTFSLNLDNFNFTKVDLVKGIEISNGQNGIISFDEDDINLVKLRLKKEGSNE